MLRRQILLAVSLAWFYTLHAQGFTPRDAADIQLALKKLTVLGSVLYVAAHPDDENTAFLAAMAKGRLYRTAYLSLTRGEGGQNLIGPEQGEMLGLIRTQELLAARRIDGAEQYFTRAIDFGFSKTTEETMRIWNKERILADVVWIIRSFRPDVIVSRFTPALGGHGNHTASAVLAEEAFRAAADPARFPEQLQFVAPWQAKRIVWNVFRFSAADSARPPGTIAFNVGGYSPLLGKSFTEIAGEGRSMHKSQGFGAAQNRGELMNAFQHIDGDSARTDLFDGITTTWSRIAGADTVMKTLEQARKTFDPENPSSTIPVLFRAMHQLNELASDPWIEVKKRELTEAILACAGLWIDATTRENSVVPGHAVKFTTTVVNRSRSPFVLQRIALPFGGTDTLLRAVLSPNRPIRNDWTLGVPAQAALSQPYWLIDKSDVGAYQNVPQPLIGVPENTPPVSIRFLFSSPDGELDISVPLRQQVIDPIDGESILPFSVIPPVSIRLQDPVIVFAKVMERTARITLTSSLPNIKGIIRLKLPPGWHSTPAEQSFTFANAGDESSVTFSLRPTNGAQSGSFMAEATIGTMTVSRGIITARYSHIPPQTLYPPAEGKLLRFDLRIKGKTIGYIMGAGDEVPRAIEQMGYSVSMLSDADLAGGSLDRYDAVVAGIRSYNTRPALRKHHGRLMEYVRRGGTYVVQYMTPGREESQDIGPYPFTVSRDRVAEEDAVVSILHPDHSIASTPNRITERDFEGWVQERGLSFADRWDVRYDSLLVCHDAGEPNRAGGLLAAKYGQGRYVYCGYAFFRQLPAGIEGAYRLFANILSYQRDKLRQLKTAPDPR